MGGMSKEAWGAADSARGDYYFAGMRRAEEVQHGGTTIDAHCSRRSVENRI